MSQAMKNVIITGSSNGFGFLAAKAFAEKGYKVWATMRNSNTKNLGSKQVLESFSKNIKVAEMDVADDASVKICIDAIATEDGHIDVLINNAGIMYIGITEAYSLEQAHEQMNINYYGVIRVTQAVLPFMRKAESGLIINNTSIAGRLSYPYLGTYCATKFAVEGYTQSLRYELAPFGIDVSIVEPGPFGTNLINSISPEARKDVLREYGELKDVPQNMLKFFKEFFETAEAPDPQLVIDQYLQLAEANKGDRPTRLIAGIDHGAKQINELTQPIQDNLLKELQLDFLLATKV